MAMIFSRTKYFWAFAIFMNFCGSILVYGDSEIPTNIPDEDVVTFLEDGGYVEKREDLLTKIGNFTEPASLQHHDYNSLTRFLQRLARTYPYLCILNSIGRSTENRELWVLTISRNPQFHEPGKPEFKYVANMHGNEVFGRVAMLYLAEMLLENYGKNRYISSLVDRTRIHIMPSMNPDGYERAHEGDESSIIGRGNAHGVDLNRNFPIRRDRPGPRNEIETRLIMEWTLSIPFVLSANIHSGTTLVNYPYDDRSNGKSHTGDHDVFVTLAYSYARAHERMYKKGPRCLNEDLSLGDPESGITNGADWYEVTGGMQDWNYLVAGCFEVTVETNCVKFPHARELPFYWNENKYSLLHFISLVHHSIHGFIFDEETGIGIWNATISVTQSGQIVKSYRYGDYWRLVTPGKYEVTFDHPNYFPVTRSVTITKENPSSYLNVTLRPHSYTPSNYVAHIKNRQISSSEERDNEANFSNGAISYSMMSNLMAFLSILIAFLWNY